MDKCGNLEVNRGSERGAETEEIESGRNWRWGEVWCSSAATAGSPARVGTIEVAPILEKAEQRLTSILGDNSL